MRRGEAWKPLRERGGWMRLSEKAVFYVLLDRADNADCAIPAWMTPSLVQLAEACSCSTSTVKLALNHLQLHKWLIRISKPNAGQGHKASYQLTEGQPCDCPRPVKRADSRPFHEEKRADSRTFKRADSHPENSRSDAVSDEGISEGKDRQGSARKRRALCGVCQLPMDPVLPVAGFATHPCCDPDETSPAWPTASIKILVPK